MACQGTTEDREAKLASTVDKEPADEISLNFSPDLNVDSGEIMDQQEDQMMINYPAFQENQKPKDQYQSPARKAGHSHSRVVILRNLKVTAENDVQKSVSWNDEDDIGTIKEKLYKKAILRKGTEKISFPHVEGYPFGNMGK